jgi:hypothetical protein
MAAAVLCFLLLLQQLYLLPLLLHLLLVPLSPVHQ